MIGRKQKTRRMVGACTARTQDGKNEEEPRDKYGACISRGREAQAFRVVHETFSRIGPGSYGAYDVVFSATRAAAANARSARSRNEAKDRPRRRTKADGTVASNGERPRSISGSKAVE